MKTKLNLAEVVQRFEDLGSMPEILTQVQTLASERSSLQDISEIIAQDPTLTLRAIAEANSEASTQSDEVGNVFDAMSRIGRDTLYLLVGSVKHRKASTQLSGPDILFSDFWANSVCCALAVSALSRKLSIATPRDVYPIGLLHSVGWALLCLTVPVQSEEITKQCAFFKRALAQAQRKCFGLTHFEVSIALLTALHVPQRIIIPIGYQSDPETAPDFQKECALLHIGARIADCIAPAWKPRHGLQQLLTHIHPSAFRLTSADEQTIREVYSEVSMSLSFVLELIDLSTFSEEQEPRKLVII